MNLHEVYRNLMMDKPKLDWKRDSLFPKAIKAIRRQGEFPAWVTYEYKLPESKNNYVIYFSVEHPYGNIMCDYFCVLFDENKRYIVKRIDTEIPELHVLTTHFLQRYNERFLKDASLNANETAVRYFTRNNVMKPMTIDERINKNIGEYGDYAGEGFLVPDGFCFKLSGEETADNRERVRIGLFTTFMPRAEMSESQREAILEECIRDSIRSKSA